MAARSVFRAFSTPRSARALSTAPRAAAPTAAAPAPAAASVALPKVLSAISSSPSTVDVKFADGAEFRYHNIWLRDSCRAEKQIQASSERVLDNSALLGRVEDPAVSGIKLDPADGSTVTVNWANDPSVDASTFDASFLRAYADLVAKPLSAGSAAAPAEASEFFEFLDPIAPKAMDQTQLNLWKNDGNFNVPVFKHADLKENRFEFMKALMTPGAVIVDGMPDDPTCDGHVIEEFCREYLGSMQKHPLRETAHWTISTEVNVKDASNMLGDEELRKGANSYNTDQQLCNHTDQSLYGTPGLLLGFHCAFGEGNNSLTDGFAVAHALKERHPEHFETLTKVGMNAGRRLLYYEDNDLMFNSKAPVLNLDKEGNLMRVQFHEIYRTPSTESFEDFPKFWKALSTFYGMVHSPEFQCHLTVKKHQFLIMNNWRTMHGRAGLKGKARTILGGTVTKDAFYSASRIMQQEALQANPRFECGLPTKNYGWIAHTK